MQVARKPCEPDTATSPSITANSITPRFSNVWRIPPKSSSAASQTISNPMEPSSRMATVVRFSYNLRRSVILGGLLLAHDLAQPDSAGLPTGVGRVGAFVRPVWSDRLRLVPA